MRRATLEGFKRPFQNSMFAVLNPFVPSKWPPFVAVKTSALAEPLDWQSNIPVLTDRWEPPPLTFLIHISIMRDEQGLWVTLVLDTGQVRTSIARQGSRAALACVKSPPVLRTCPGRSTAGIKSSGLTELCCLLGVNMLRALSVTT